jgi:iron complex transport system permease protein
MRRNKTAAYILCGISAAALFLLSLSAGAARVGVGDVIRWLSGGAIPESSRIILAYVRLPRNAAAFMCGGALALSGLLLQSGLNNPLASAGTVGVNAGAGFSAVLASVLFPGAFAAKPAAAFFGALSTALLVYGVARRIGASRNVIILTGIALSSLLSAALDATVTLKPDSVLDRAAFFIGGFAHAELAPLRYALPCIAAGALGSALLAPFLNALSLGDEVAHSLGVPVAVCRFLSLLCAALLASSAVCVAGLLGFAGLLVPHAARFLVGRDHKALVPFTALSGGVLVLGCDLLARVIFAPYELPVGILLSFLGAPFFLLLLFRKARGGAG